MINIDKKKIRGAKNVNLCINARGARVNAVLRRRPIFFIIFNEGHNLIYKNGTPRVR
jgi:hypothetical protein